jgi:hypothetical protein
MDLYQLPVILIGIYLINYITNYKNEVDILKKKQADLRKEYELYLEKKFYHEYMKRK